MRPILALSLGLMGVLIASPALALTITNDDAGAHTVIVTKGSASQDVNVGSQQKVEADCTGGCVVQIKGVSDKYDMKGAELLSIDDNVIYVDDDPSVDAQFGGSGGTSQASAGQNK